MKGLFVFFITILAFYTSDAAIRRVGYKGSPLAGVDYPDFASAYNASASGDTIQVYGNLVVASPGVAIRKKIIIHGFGYNLDVHRNLQATSVDAPSRFMGNQILSFEPGSENSVIEGCVIVSEAGSSTYIKIATSNITIRRSCISAILENSARQINDTRIESSVVTYLVESTSQGQATINTQISNCILNAGAVTFYKAGSTGSIVNCVQMPHGSTYYLSFLSLNSSSFLVKNCIFDYPYQLPNAPNVTWENCFFRSPQPAQLPKGTNNRWGQTYGNLFETLGSTAISPGHYYQEPQNCQGCPLFINNLFNENYYQLKANSPARNGGFDSNGNASDCGIFGGDSAARYKLGGVPTIPSIYELTASSPEANVNPYKVITSVRSNAQKSITRVEYYMDHDPGFGKATPLAITPGFDLGSLTILVNPERLSPCMHTLYVRAQDAAGSWSLVSSHTFQNTYISPTAKPQDYMVQFAGVNDYLDLGTWFNQQKFTLSFWVKPDSIQTSGAAIAAIQNDLYLYANPTARDNYILAHLLQFDMLPDQWNHVTITVDGTTNTRQLYLFGQLIDSNQWNYMPQNGFNLTFGKGGFFPNSYFKGALDEIRLWNQVLSPDSIYLNVSRPLNGNEPGLLGYWNFNNGCQETAPDLTINNHPAILKNGLAKVLSTVPNIGQQIIPNKGGNTNIVTVKVYDNLFQSGSIARLERDGHPNIIADTVIINKSGTIATCTFDLTGTNIGSYHLGIKSPNGSEKLYPNGFTIEQGTKPKLWIDVSGRHAIRSGRPYTLQVAYGNSGNIDAKGVPIWVSFPLDATITANFDMLRVNTADSAIYDSVQLVYEIDTVINAMRIREKFVGLYFPVIPAGYTGYLSFTIDYHGSSDTLNISAEINKPFYNSPIDEDVINCFVNFLLPEALGLYAPAACVTSALNAFYNPILNIMFLPNQFLDENRPVSFAYGFANVLIDCSGAGSIWRGVRLAMKTARYFKHLKTVTAAGDFTESCGDLFQLPEDEIQQPIPRVSSFDPNEKVGPNLYQRKDIPFNYTILFENKSDATAAAQEVLIIDTLDKAKFDISTFSFGAIAIGDTITSATYLYDKQFSKNIDLRPVKNLIVKAEGRVDTTSGIAYWRFASLDPATMLLTEDPLLGFLPPNVTSPEGEGWVSFNIRPFDAVPDGTVLKNKATIIFDYNAPIITNVHENIIDKTPPISNVLQLAQDQLDSNFVVKWTGSDNLSGVKQYNIYVAIDTGGFKLWKANYSDTIAKYNGLPGHQYRFYSIATDSAGNIEPNKAAAETSTRVVGVVTAVPDSPTSDYGLKVFPNPAGNGVWFEFTLPSVQQVRITIFDITGKKVGVIANRKFNSGTHKLYYSLSHLQPGFYIGELMNKEQKQSIKIFKK